MKFSFAFFLFGMITTISTYFTISDAHGMMCTPRQRGAYKSTKCGDMHDLDKIMSDAGSSESDIQTDHCAHCLNGGAVATVKNHLGKNGWTHYDPIEDFDGSATRSGICGDPVGNDDHMIGGPFVQYKNVPMVENWKQGAAVDFSTEIDTNHNGYFEFFLCDLDSCGTTDIEGKCFKNGHCVKLNRIPHPDCENPKVNTQFECGPIDDAYPGRYYLPCRKTDHVGVHVVGGKTGTMRYQLPKDFKCKHCVVQWYWATANSCAPRGFLEYFQNYNDPFGDSCPSDGGALGARNPTMAECGGERQPEEFWSCADVQITSDGTSAGSVEAVGTETTTTTTTDNESNEEEENPITEPERTPSPEATSVDEQAAKDNPEGVVEKVKEEVTEDIEMAASESTGEKKREEQAAAAGECIAEDTECDGSIPCCDVAQVCVHTNKGFTCRFWWSLWKDVNERRDSM